MGCRNTHAPALSDESIMAEFPEARRSERDALLDMVAFRPGSVVVDLQAAGGYVADAVYDLLGGDVQCICVEPTPELNRRIRKVHRVCTDPLDRMGSIADDSVDAVVGLAGLHHSPMPSRTIRESLRMLKPGGQFAVCDVESGSAMAEWLNGYVDANTPGGHKGWFFEPGDILAQLLAAGFENVWEERRDVPWAFASNTDMVRFFRGLFGLKASAAEVEKALRRHLTVRSSGGKVLVDWHLIYASATKPLARSNGQTATE
jgi:SAM-dependent methyltransferase